MDSTNSNSASSDLLEQELTPEQREIVAPHVAELQMLLRQAAQKKSIIHQMLTLIKPEMGVEGSGWSFDNQRMKFTRIKEHGVD